MGASVLYVGSIEEKKNITALLRGFAALVTSEQYEQLARTNPGEAERLRVLAFSSEVGLPPVFAAATANPVERDRLRDLLGRLREVPDGSTVLTMLGFDGFTAEVAATAAHPAIETPPAVESEAGAPASSSTKPPAVAKSTPPANKTKPRGRVILLQKPLVKSPIAKAWAC